MLEQIRERTYDILASSSSPSSRCNQAVTSKSATCTERGTRADVTRCSSPTRLFNAAKTFRCQGCDNKKPRPQTHKVSPPRPHTFNHEVGVDGFEIVDSLGMRFSILNAVCMETTYDQAWIVRESENLGSPSSHACLRAFVHGWTRWAGWPNLFRCDRRTHNRGVLGSIFAKNGVAIRPAGLEAPEQIGRVERRGEMLRKMMSKVIKDTHASGRESVDMILSDCLMR